MMISGTTVPLSVIQGYYTGKWRYLSTILFPAQQEEKGIMLLGEVECASISGPEFQIKGMNAPEFGLAPVRKIQPVCQN
jgi:hypothetical protein